MIFGWPTFICVTPPFSINFRCQFENQVSDYMLLGASSFNQWNKCRLILRIQGQITPGETRKYLFSGLISVISIYVISPHLLFHISCHLVEQGLLTLLEHPSSHVSSEVRVTRIFCFMFYYLCNVQCLVDRCLPFCPF
jgi:hypothetical protein